MTFLDHIRRALEAREQLVRAEAERDRHTELVAFLSAPAEYRPGRASRKVRRSGQRGPLPTISVMGGRPSAAAGEPSSGKALRLSDGVA